MSAGKVVLLVFGIILLLISVGLLFAGGTLVWLDQTHKDRDGFISTDTIDLERTSYAIATRPADIDLEEMWPWDKGDLAKIKVEATDNNPSNQIFIGIAKQSDVEDYLDGVEYDEITKFRIHPLIVDYKDHPGSSIPPDPASQEFWEVSKSGTGTQTLEWEVEKGTWMIVLMNANGSAGINLSGSIGIKAPWIFGLGIGLLVGGTVLLIISVIMIYFAARRPIVRSETMGAV